MMMVWTRARKLISIVLVRLVSSASTAEQRTGIPDVWRFNLCVLPHFLNAGEFCFNFSMIYMYAKYQKRGGIARSKEI